MEETTESKGGHFAKWKSFSIAKMTFVWRGLKFNRCHGPLCPYFCHLCHLGITTCIVMHKILKQGNVDIFDGLELDSQNLTHQKLLKALQHLQVHGDHL